MPVKVIVDDPGDILIIILIYCCRLDIVTVFVTAVEIFEEDFGHFAFIMAPLSDIAVDVLRLSS